jgi:hypothetical protein
MPVVVVRTKVRHVKDQVSETVVPIMGMSHLSLMNTPPDMRYVDTAEVPVITALRRTAKRTLARAMEGRRPLFAEPL